MIQKKPLLSFEFANSTGEITPITFENPNRIIIAKSIDDVLPCLKLVQEAVDEGMYAAGYVSYESAPAFDSAIKVNVGGTMPYLWFGIFSEPVRQSIAGHGDFSVSKWKPSVTMDEYRHSISSIKQAIENGDTYQTNYTIRLHAQFQGDDTAFFERLKKAQSSHYCAYLNTGEHSILSASPELFFHLKGNKITTRPMKGTIKREVSFEEDTLNATELYHSDKNRAENVMIVDLLRNDLGVIAEPGSVTVEKLFSIEQYPTVHQMTSTISAQIPDHIKIVDIFKALFPCGSITGAPKISTMELIAELENAPREVYCGAIGYITPNKEAIFNVPIRTVLIDHHSGNATYGVGGGITWDSTTEGEYYEILAKASLLEEKPVEFQLLESILLDNGKYFLIDEHLKRLKNSAEYFGFQVNIADVKRALDNFSEENQKGLMKVRLLVPKAGDIVIEGQMIDLENKVFKVMLASEALDVKTPFLYHKTTNREVYKKFQTQKPSDVFDVLLWNQEGEVTEFTNGNIVVEMDGGLWTPPVTCGLLAGTFRKMLLESGEIRERIINIADLKKCKQVWFINSVRKWRKVHL